jgi:hypothetical protein
MKTIYFILSYARINVYSYTYTHMDDHIYVTFTKFFNLKNSFFSSIKNKL